MCCFSQFYIMLIVYIIFAMIWQNKQIEEITLDSENLWWALLYFFILSFFVEQMILVTQLLAVLYNYLPGLCNMQQQGRHKTTLTAVI